MLFRSTQLGPLSTIRAIKPYKADSEEHIALVLSDATTSYNQSKIIVISTKGTLLRDAYLIPQYHLSWISLSSNGLLTYYQNTYPNGKIPVLDLERGGPSTQGYHTRRIQLQGEERVAILPGGSKLMLIHQVLKRRSAIPANSSGGLGSNSRTARGPTTVFACTLSDVATKEVIQTFYLSEPAYFSCYRPMEIAISSDDHLIAFTGYYDDTRSTQGAPLVIQVWTWTGEVYTRTIEHSTSNLWTYEHYIDITQDGKKLLVASGQGLTMFDLDSIARGDQTWSMAHYTGSPTHISTALPEWIYRCERREDINAQIIDKNNNKVLGLPKRMIERLDPPGSSHVIKRDRLKIDAPKLLEMQNWVDFFKHASGGQRA